MTEDSAEKEDATERAPVKIDRSDNIPCEDRHNAERKLLATKAEEEQNAVVPGVAYTSAAAA